MPLNYCPELDVRQYYPSTAFLPSVALGTLLTRKILFAIHVVDSFSIIASNGTYAKYYPSGAIALSRPFLTRSNMNDY